MTMNNDLERKWKETVVASYNNYTSICLQILKNPNTNFRTLCVPDKIWNENIPEIS
jgi:hypothetical protein